MSKLNLTRKTFLEKEELNRFQDFLEYNSTRHVTLSNTLTWGIVRSNFSGEDLNFKVELGSNIGSIKVNKEISYALDKDGLLINLPQTLNFAIPNDSQWYWLRVSHQYRRFEEGYVNVDTLGNISGTNTKFTETLRGQATEVPTKIRFTRDDGQPLVNTDTYEIIDIGSNIIAAATSTVGFVAESNLRMIVIGATPISESVTGEQLEGLYKYDGCLLKYVLEVSGEPTLIADKQFHIARVKNDAGSVTIEDKRTQYWSSNVPGVSDKLSMSANLSDVDDPAAARTNLEVYSKIESDNNYMAKGQSFPYLDKSQNLNDVANKGTARTNLDVYSTSQVDGKFTVETNPPLSSTNGTLTTQSTKVSVTPNMVLINSSFTFSHGTSTSFTVTMGVTVPRSIIGSKFIIWDSKSGFTHATLLASTPLQFRVDVNLSSNSSTDFIINTCLIY